MQSSTMKRSLISGVGLLLIAALFLGINIISSASLRNARLDLTSDKLFTLSDGTRSVLKEIREPVTLRFYFSDRLGKEIPSYGVFATRIREMLQEYASAANGMVKLELIDPQPFSDEEDRAVSYGLQGVPVNQAGELVYFGLAGFNAADKEETIPFFQPERERFLEYDLTRLIYNLASPKKKVVGLISSLPLTGEFRGPRQPPEPWALYNHITQFFELRPLDGEVAKIPDDVTVLMIVHPKDLPEKTLYAIDQFVLRGGRALVFVDPHNEAEMARPGLAAQTGQTSSNLPKLFDAWGIEMVQGKFAGDRAAARRVNAGTETRIRAVDYVAWLALRPANFNRDDILTAEANLMQMASAGILKAKPGATTTLTPLIRTSTQAMQIDVESIKMAPDPVKLLADFKPENEAFILATRLRGPVNSAFPDGPPPEKPKEGEQPKEGAAQPASPAPAAAPAAEHLKQSREAVNLIVVADTDFLEDRFWVQVQDFFGQRVAFPNAANGDFVVNALDNLAGSNALIGLRGRGIVARPFTKVQEIQQVAESRFRAKERELTEKLRETERKLSELQTKDQGGGKVILTAEQQATIDDFRKEVVKTRKELRDVQLELRKDIQGLETWLKFANIALIPILIGIAALLVAAARRGRRRAAVHGTARAQGAQA